MPFLKKGHNSPGRQVPRSPALPRRQRERLRQREEILQAALELFSQKGFHNVTMRDIARKAEFSVGTLYNFFKDKQDLYRALILNRAQRFHEALGAVLDRVEQEPPLEVLRQYLERKTALLMESAAGLKLYFAERPGASYSLRAGLDREVRELYDDLLRRLTRVFQRGVEQKVFRPLDPQAMAIAFEGLVHGFLQYWIEDADGKQHQAHIPLILDLFYRGALSRT